MVTGKVKEELNAEAILKRVSEYDIYRFYIGYDFPLGKVMPSPMPGRRDSHPSFIVGAKYNFLYHLDFADSRYRGNCFQFVMQKEMLPNYNSALQKIDRDFGLGIRETPLIDVQKPVFVQPTIENTEITRFTVVYTDRYTQEELEYWRQFYITKEELKENEVYAVRKFLINRHLQPMRKGELTFGYKLGEFWKIYRPYACKDRKWKNNIPSNRVENLEVVMGQPKVIVTKSRKDRIVLQKFLPKEVCSVQSEGIHVLDDESIRALRLSKEVFINYDADEPGKRSSWEVTTEFGFKHLNVPDMYLAEGIKDFADLIKVYGPDKVGKYLQLKGII